ncbi:MAG TPA: hypothetical protein VLL77_07710 [Anaerolineales bacterium]|nr:hypothetical protein [Anaerolineales bacterium]
MDLALIALRLLAFLVGVVLIGLAVLSALRTFVLPRGARDPITRRVFQGLRGLLDLRLRSVHDYKIRDNVLALYVPIGLLVLPLVWLALVTLGFAGVYWALGVRTPVEAFLLSGSSLLTLGFVPADGVLFSALAFLEAAIGLILVALLIAYLPTMYAAFSRRERAVNLLEVRAGTPPSAVELLLRFNRLGRLDQLTDLWIDWEAWFAEVEESHTSLAMLVFFRSPNPNRSWVTASGAVLDAASLTAAFLDIPRNAQVDLCIRAGYLALREVAAYFQIPFPTDPRPDDPISIRREEFDAACDRLAEHGLPVKPDRDQAWKDFAGWRVNYDSVLIDLARMTTAPPDVPWSTDAARRTYHPPRPSPESRRAASPAGGLL